jgi:dihydroorotate dehydrogenase electron transfer subunit
MDHVDRGPPAEQRKATDFDAAVIQHTQVSKEYWHLVLKTPSDIVTAVPGQFYHLKCPRRGADYPYFRRPMSIYRADSGSGQLEFLYKVTGVGTRGLASLVPGQSLRLLGPLGVGFTMPDCAKNIIVLGRGVGLATLAPLSEMAAARNVGVTAILSARDPESVISKERFSEFASAVEVVLDSDGSSSVVNVEQMIRDLHGRGLANAFYTCGSNRLMLLLQNLSREFGVPGEVALEEQMACGIGMCFCCVRTFRSNSEIVSRRVCWDGPVFKLTEAMSW